MIGPNTYRFIFYGWPCWFLLTTTVRAFWKPWTGNAVQWTYAVIAAVMFAVLVRSAVGYRQSSGFRQNLDASAASPAVQKLTIAMAVLWAGAVVLDLYGFLAGR